MGNPVPTDEWIPVRLRVLGSRIDLFVNEVKVCSTLRNISKSQVELFLRGPQEIKVRNIKAMASKPQAFVVMQFSGERRFDHLTRCIRLLRRPVPKARPEPMRHGGEAEFLDQFR